MTKDTARSMVNPRMPELQVIGAYHRNDVVRADPRCASFSPCGNNIRLC